MNEVNNNRPIAFWGSVGGVLIALASLVSSCSGDNAEPAKPAAVAPIAATQLIEATPTPASGGPEATKDGITYRLDEIAVEGDDLIFWMMAANKGEDQKVAICYDACHIVDDKGDEHESTEIISGDTHQRGWLAVMIRGGINTRFGIKFAKQAKVKAVQRLDVTTNNRQLLFALMLQSVPVPFKAGSG